MDNHDLEKITKLVNDKIYFKEAHNWYYQKYLKPYSYRLYWLILALICSLIILSLALQIKAWFPLVTQMPIVIKNSDSTNQKLLVKNISTKYDNPDYDLLEYFLISYIKLRGEYKVGSLSILDVDNRIQKVRNNSSSKVAKDFQKMFQAEDATNPIKRIGRGGYRKITILNVFFPELKTGIDSIINQIKNTKTIMPTTAIIKFHSLENNIFGKENRGTWQANISFLFSGTIKNLENNNLTISKFTITSYEEKQIKN